MSDSNRKREFLGDLSKLMTRHGGWMTKQAAQQLAHIRAKGMAEFERGFPVVAHTSLDERLVRLPVQLGVAESVDVTKALIVARYCQLLQPKAVLEIGTFRGGMTATIGANTASDCQIWTLDLPSEEVDQKASEYYATDVAMAKLANDRVGEEWHEGAAAARTTQLWGDSLTYDFSGLGPFDLIYIDGSHAEKWVERDTENAFALLAETGAILWDDCYWRDVQRVLGRYAVDHPIHFFEDGHTAGYLRLDGEGVRASEPSSD